MTTPIAAADRGFLLRVLSTTATAWDLHPAQPANPFGTWAWAW